MNQGNFAKRAHSTVQDTKEAVAEIKRQLGDEGFSLVLFFASKDHNPAEVSSFMQESFSSAHTVGCTTCGEIFGGMIYAGSIVAIGLGGDILRGVNCALVKNLDDFTNVDNAMESLAKKVGTPMDELEPKTYVGILLADGLESNSEHVISRLSNLTNIPFIGGVAGDDWEMKNTFLYFDGKYYQNAAILLLLEPTRGYKVLKEESFAPRGRVFTATEVDMPRRRIKTINNEPAGSFYLKELGISKEQANIKVFNDHPLGFVFCDDVYVHDIREIDKDDCIRLYVSLEKGVELQMLYPTGIIKGTENFLTREIHPLESVRAVINFNCASRCKKLITEGLLEEYDNLYKDLPAIGLGTYGEFYLSFLNQTSTLLVLF